jgi:hypothetical protein
MNQFRGKHLRLKPSWVYEHADELGAYRLGKYLRFALPRVMERQSFMYAPIRTFPAPA